ncbi:RnfABCDGE type electron transport complex subunit D [Candidatus Auribacterota bacterium]
MKIVQQLFGKLGSFVKNNPKLRKYYPIVKAMDEFLLGTDKTTNSAPHILDRIDFKRYMSLVILALIPATIAGVYFYGLRVLAIILVSYIFGGITEIIFSVVRRKPLYEGFWVTGLIFPLVLPSTIPLWMVAVGSVFGVFFGKEVFCVAGRNIFNPALVGRVFLTISFPAYFASLWQKPFTSDLGGFLHYSSDAITSATPLIDFKSTQTVTDIGSLLLGVTAGSIGETFRIGIILGGIFLIAVKIVDWRIPLGYILSTALCSFILSSMVPDKFAPPLFQILSGGLLFGAFFMASEPVTAPFTKEGKWIFAFFLGILTVLIRGISGFVEGVMIAILLMNAASSSIDTIIVNLKFKKVFINKED